MPTVFKTLNKSKFITYYVTDDIIASDNNIFGNMRLYHTHCPKWSQDYLPVFIKRPYQEYSELYPEDRIGTCYLCGTDEYVGIVKILYSSL